MIIKVRVIPNAADNEVISRIGSVLRVRVASPTVDNRANEVLRGYLGEFFQVRTSRINIVRGAKGREKTVEIEGRSEEDLKGVLDSIP